MEGITKSLPVSELPDIKSKEELAAVIADKEAALKEMKDMLMVLVWCTDFSKIKPIEKSTMQWVTENIDYYITKQNYIGNLEIFIYKLKLWLQNWDDVKVVKGFRQEPKHTKE